VGAQNVFVVECPDVWIWLVIVPQRQVQRRER
jgi:hypothetical protein